MATAAILSLVLAACASPTEPLPVSLSAARNVPVGLCGSTATPPKRYEHVVLLLEENRTWTGGRSPSVGLGFSPAKMPYLHALAERCSYYQDWAETSGTQDSLNQYVGLTSGVANDSTVDDCTPSATCRSTDDNIFRQIRMTGGTARTYVDGADTPCSVGTNRAKHIPAIYYQGGEDPAHCTTEVRPLAELDPQHLPTLAFIVPDQCHDGHDCDDTQVDAFAARTLAPILAGPDYAAGKTLVVVIYDEDRPVPNLLIAPTAHVGAITTAAGSHADLLKTMQTILGLPVLQQGQLAGATSLRSSAHL